MIQWWLIEVFFLFFFLKEEYYSVPLKPVLMALYAQIIQGESCGDICFFSPFFEKKFF